MCQVAFVVCVITLITVILIIIFMMFTTTLRPVRQYDGSPSTLGDAPRPRGEPTGDQEASPARGEGTDLRECAVKHMSGRPRLHGDRTAHRIRSRGPIPRR